jgi:hypothetical protein
MASSEQSEARAGSFDRDSVVFPHPCIERVLNGPCFLLDQRPRFHCSGRVIGDEGLPEQRTGLLVLHSERGRSLCLQTRSDLLLENVRCLLDRRQILQPFEQSPQEEVGQFVRSVG